MIMIMVQDGSRSDPAPEPHPRQPLRVGQQLVGEDRIEVGEVGRDQGDERPDDDAADHPPITGTRVSEQPADTQRHRHHRERDDRDRVEEEQRAVESKANQGSQLLSTPTTGMPNRQSRPPTHKIAAAIRATIATHHRAGVPTPLITRMQLSGPTQPSVPGLMPFTASMPIGRATISQPAGSAR